MNLIMAEKVLESLALSGVDSVCLCAGARNAPFVEVLSQSKGLNVYSHFEERGASFFALGLIKRKSQPVAVITTSGTAVAELLPAVIEAHYSGLPLVVVTADRPKAYRNSGAPQSIKQKDIFGSYVLKSYDFEKSIDEEVKISNEGPTQINICFDEPLIDGEVPQVEFEPKKGLAKFNAWDTPREAGVGFSQFFEKTEKPLVIIGGLPPFIKDEIVEFLVKLNAPIYAEAHSGLRESEKLSPLIIKSSEKSLQKKEFIDEIDGVIRIGGVPVLRFWRDLEENVKDLPVISISHRPFSGLAREENKAFSLNSFLNWWKEEADSFAYQKKPSIEFTKRTLIESLFKEEASSEPAMIHELSKLIPEGSRLFLGNSMPIREWDLAATFENRNLKVYSNRGANGIDGLISTFFGVSEKGKENWALIGDLSALYDLSAPWLTQQLETKQLRVVVVNNGGGKIFSRLFNNPLYENQHDLNFKSWSELFGWDYVCWDKIPHQLNLAARPTVIELKPSQESTKGFWEVYEKLWIS